MMCRGLTKAIHSAPSTSIYYDLRAACLLHSNNVTQALDDAMNCTKLNPDW